MELINILKEHTKKYPKMLPCDVVKLIYQNEFGGGHLIKDKAQSLKRIQEEYNSTEHDLSIPLYEEIGNSIVRVNLAAIDVNNYSLEQLNNDFIYSSSLLHGDRTSFESKLTIVLEYFEEFHFSFSKEEFDKYLKQYKKDGYPMVSHSHVYQKAYKPAYRVLLKRLTR